MGNLTHKTENPEIFAAASGPAVRRRPLYGRKGLDWTVKGLAVLATLFGVLLLCWILLTVLQRGWQSWNYAFFTEPTKPYGIPDGGVANAIVGTLAITGLATLIAVPAGLLGGVYLAEFARNSRLGTWIRFATNVMIGFPSIIVGLFVYSLLVYTTKNFSGFAGAVALAIIMYPVVLRNTEDILAMVPNELREAALALGMPRWRAILHIVFRAAKTGLVTGVLLSIARVSGETAPLLFTALWSDGWPGLSDFFTQPTANLTVTITEYATNSPFAVIQERAWGAALLITMGVLFLNILARTMFRVRKI